MKHKGKKDTLDNLIAVACRQYIKPKKGQKRKNQAGGEANSDNFTHKR